MSSPCLPRQRSLITRWIQKQGWIGRLKSSPEELLLGFHYYSMLCALITRGKGVVASATKGWSVWIQRVLCLRLPTLHTAMIGILPRSSCDDGDLLSQLPSPPFCSGRFSWCGLQRIRTREGLLCAGIRIRVDGLMGGWLRKGKLRTWGSSPYLFGGWGEDASVFFS